MDKAALDGFLEWTRSNAAVRIADWSVEFAAAAAMHPVPAALLAGAVLLVFALARDIWSALAAICIFLLALWAIARLGESDARIAAAVIGTAGLVGIAVCATRWRSQSTRLKVGIRALQKELQSTKDLLQREIDWRMAGEGAARATPSSASPTSEAKREMANQPPGSGG